MNDPAEGSGLRVVRGERLWEVRLATPKANILDAAKMSGLREIFRAAGETPALAAVLLTAEGPHFSFGASVEEHLPDRVAAMLASFHGVFRAIAASGVPVVAAVRGQCLGGGLELVSFCHRVFAAPDAMLGQPEIKLGVFAPVASVLLPERVGRGAADDLLLSGRSIDATQALRIGLVDEVGDDPEGRARAYVEDVFGPLSAAVLRHAARAAREEFHRRMFTALEHLEQSYLDELMETADAVEGLRAFIAKRKPQWSHR